MIFGNDMEKVTKKCAADLRFPKSVMTVEKVDNVDYYSCKIQNSQLYCAWGKKNKCSKVGCYPPKTFQRTITLKWICGKVYFPSSSLPILTTSPAPMVINKSPLVQFCKRNFSISLKFSIVGK